MSICELILNEPGICDNCGRIMCAIREGREGQKKYSLHLTKWVCCSVEPPFPDYDEIDEDLLRIFSSHNQEMRAGNAAVSVPPAEPLPLQAPPPTLPVGGSPYVSLMGRPDACAAQPALVPGSQIPNPRAQGFRGSVIGEGRGGPFYMWPESDSGITRGTFPGQPSQHPELQGPYQQQGISLHSWPPVSPTSPNTMYLKLYISMCRPLQLTCKAVFFAMHQLL